jgi:hypothetical protein
MPALKTRLCIFWLKANWPKAIAPMWCLADRYVAPLLVQHGSWFRDNFLSKVSWSNVYWKKVFG